LILIRSKKSRNKNTRVTLKREQKKNKKYLIKEKI